MIPICGDPECGGCPTPIEMELFTRQMHEDGKRQANLILGLPEYFNVDRELIER